MRILWNKVTWYSKCGALFFFLVIFPIITFYIGREYQKTIEVLSLVQNSASVPLAYTKENPTGLQVRVYKKGVPFAQGIRIHNTATKEIIETLPNEEGMFTIFIPAGTYSLSTIDGDGVSKTVTITKDSLVQTIWSLD